MNANFKNPSAIANNLWLERIEMEDTRFVATGNVVPFSSWNALFATVSFTGTSFVANELADRMDLDYE